MMKINAYLNRDRIRDLYDISYIIENYWDALNSVVQNSFTYALSEKGLTQFDLVICQQNDNLIDKGKLLEKFLLAYEKIGLNDIDQQVAAQKILKANKLLSKVSLHEKNEQIDDFKLGEKTPPNELFARAKKSAEALKKNNDSYTHSFISTSKKDPKR